MPPETVAAKHFSPDTRAFIRLLTQHGVRFVIVGGEAVIFYGSARLTGDVDFYYGREEENVRRLLQALREFWGGSVPGALSIDDLIAPGMIVQFGRPPNRIDLMNTVDGVSFDEVWSGRRPVLIVGEGDDIPVPYIGLQALIENKRASGRPKDLVDLSFLEEAGENDVHARS